MLRTLMKYTYQRCSPGRQATSRRFECGDNMISNRSPWVRRVRTSRDAVAINQKLRDGVRGVLAEARFC